MGVVRALFEELATLLERLADPARLDHNEKGDTIARATSIVLALQGGLDFEHGADVAQNLAQLYDWLVRTLVGAITKPNPESIELAGRVVRDLASAWRVIAQPR